MNFCAVGTGAITKSMLVEYQRSAVLHCTAICSRKEETGRAMADAYGIETVYTSMEDMLRDPSIELVYVASPNGLHYEQTKRCLEAGKHVICEKPFAPTLAEARELVALAKEKHLFLFEAITTAHHPHYAMIRSRLPELGSLKVVLGTFCQYSSRYPALLAGKVSPVLDPAYKGGALMDINLYNIHFMVGLFGAPKAVHYYPNIYANGVDTSGVLVLEYDGFLCQCVGAKDCAAQNGVQIVGDSGSIRVTPSASNCQQVEVSIRGRETEAYTVEEGPWYYEVQDIGRIIAAGDYSHCYAALETTLQVVDVLEKARKDGNLGF